MPNLSAVSLLASVSAAYFYAVAVGAIPAPYPMGAYGPFFEFWGSFVAAIVLGLYLLYRCHTDRAAAVEQVTRLALATYGVGFGALGAVLLFEGVTEVWGQSWSWFTVVYPAWCTLWAIITFALATQAFRLTFRSTTDAAR